MVVEGKVEVDRAALVVMTLEEDEEAAERGLDDDDEVVPKRIDPRNDDDDDVVDEVLDVVLLFESLMILIQRFLFVCLFNSQFGFLFCDVCRDSRHQ